MSQPIDRDVAARVKNILDARNTEMDANPRGWK